MKWRGLLSRRRSRRLLKLASTLVCLLALDAASARLVSSLPSWLSLSAWTAQPTVVEEASLTASLGESSPALERPAGTLELTGVSALERELAAREGASTAQLLARQNLAAQFYRQYGKVESEAVILAEVNGIDLSRPVLVGHPCPIRQAQWQVPGGRQGQYYADAFTPPTKLGIHDQGASMGDAGWGSGPVLPKIMKLYNVPADAPCLESVAAAVADTWSVKGEAHETEGGAVQRYIPRASAHVMEAE